MITSWILYALAVSLLVSVAALAAERALMALRWPTRFVWISAVVLSVFWPFASIVHSLLPATTRPVTVLPFTIVVAAPSIADDAAIAAARLAMIDRILVWAWVAISALLVFRLIRGIVSLRQSRAAWKLRHVDGVFVKLSDNVGPAVIGLTDMEMVLPEWILTLDAPLRAIVLRHEEEHRRARDPYLLFAAAVSVALMPWNLALWFQARRLRLAIELDCDARVLRAHPSPERYGLLMLAIAQRRSIAPALFAPMLTEPMTQLERRILAMRNTTRRLVKGTVYGSGAVALASLAFASSLQSATANVAVKAVTLPAMAAPTVRKLDPSTTTGRRTTPVRREQAGNPAPRYPDMLRAANVEGAVIVRFTTDSKGVPDSSSISVITSTHDMFSNAVRAVLPKWHLAPNSTMNMPFVFVMANKTAAELGDMTKGIAANAVVVTGAPVAGSAVGAVERGVAATVTPGQPRRVTSDQTYFEFQVEKAVSPMPGNPGARYPDLLRAANVEGSVLVQFVVDNDGTPIMDTFKVLKSDHDLFTNAVKEGLPNMRFYPAQVGGKAVKQLVQMPFQFNLSKQP
jgi:TonB family protein